MQFEIKGLEELMEALHKKSEGSEKARSIVKKHTAMVQQKAMMKAPVDTGFLKRSIDLELTDGGLTGKVKATAEYSGYVELGTRFMAAQPYLEPALREVEGPFKEDLERLIEE